MPAPARRCAICSRRASLLRRPHRKKWKRMLSLEQTIDSAWERRADLASAEIESAIKPAVERTLSLLETGELRVAEPDAAGDWRVNQWLKKAVLLSFRIHANRVMDAAPAPYFDKVPLRFEGFDEAAFSTLGARAVTGAVVRRAAHIGH